MGFETSATHIVFFIAAVVLAGAVVGTLSSQIGEFQGDINSRGNLLSDELSTDIRVINDAGNVPNGPLILYVLNTGERPLNPNSTIVFVDGQPYTTLGFDVLETSEDTWRTGRVLEITVTGLTVSAGDHRAKVSVSHGVSDTLRFRI